MLSNPHVLVLYIDPSFFSPHALSCIYMDSLNAHTLFSTVEVVHCYIHVHTLEGSCVIDCRVSPDHRAETKHAVMHCTFFPEWL